jgi:ParB/RepB/Spo0J family partition protein
MATRTPAGTAPVPDSVESAVPVDELPMAPDVEFETDTIDLTLIAPHPANPRKQLGDLSDLIPSIRTQGVLHPPVVLPADRVTAAWPEHAQDLAKTKADWVVLVGHRRSAAAIEAGRTRIPVLIRRDAIADDPLAQLDAMIGENTARKPLTPVEEARAFAEQEAAGRKQHEIATRAGYSQSHVSKRLQLLKLPASMLAELETGQNPDDDDEDTDDRTAKTKPLQIKDALAYVKESGGDQFLMLAAYKLRRENRHHWAPAQLVAEVRREQQRRKQVEAATKKLAGEGTRVIDSARKELGDRYWERELRGHKAIAQARKDGTAVAEINTHGQVTYYTTAGNKPKPADNRSEAEEQRIRDERERRRAMTARAEAAAVMAAWPPTLPEAAADIVDAWLWAPGNDVAQLAQKWLIASGAGPDPGLPGHEWWQQIRTDDWPTRVRAAHALALARHEVNTRATYRQWGPAEAAWLARLANKTGYTPTEWEQARLDAVGQQPPAPKPPQGASLAFDDEDNQCWVLYFDLEVDDPAAWAEDIEDPDALDDAKAWAEQLLHDEYGIEVTGWADGQLLPGYPAHIAVFAGADNAGGELVDRDGAAAAGLGEYRLLHSAIDDVWMVLRDDEHLADHDGLDAEDLDGACAWASQVVADDCGRQVEGWQSRAGIGDGGVEHVAEFAPGQPGTTAAAELPTPRLVWSQDHGWAVHAVPARIRWPPPARTSRPATRWPRRPGRPSSSASMASTWSAGPPARTDSPATPRWWRHEPTGHRRPGRRRAGRPAGPRRHRRADRAGRPRRVRPVPGRQGRADPGRRGRGRVGGGDPVMDREEALKYHGVYWCPDWCVQDPEEHQYEQHWAEWRSFTTSDGDTVRVRPWATWWSDSDDNQVEVEIVSADPQYPGAKLSVDDLGRLRELLDDAEQDIEHHDVVEAYPGAEDDEAEAEQHDGGEGG